MSNPVITYHGVQIYLAESEWPNCRELVVVAHARGGLRKIFPGIVIDAKDQVNLAQLFVEDNPLTMPEVSAYRTESFASWKRKVVREACERNDIEVAALKDPRRTNLSAVRRTRAQAVRVLVGFMSYGEAGKEVGIDNHTSVVYWVSGAGKDKYK